MLTTEGNKSAEQRKVVKDKIDNTVKIFFLYAQVPNTSQIKVVQLLPFTYICEPLQEEISF